MAEKATAHWVRDSLVSDAMDAAKGQGADVTEQDALDFIVPILQQMDAKESEGKLIKHKPKPERTTDKRSDEFARRAKDPSGDWSATKRNLELAELATSGRQLSPLEDRMVVRLRLLRSKPELRAKMEALIPDLNSPVAEKRQRAHSRLDQILTDSNRVFGDWRKTAPRKLVFG